MCRRHRTNQRRTRSSVNSAACVDDIVLISEEQDQVLTVQHVHDIVLISEEQDQVLTVQHV